MRLTISGDVVSTRQRSYRTREGVEKSVGESYLIVEGNDVPVKVAHPSDLPMTKGDAVTLDVWIKANRFGNGLDLWARGIAAGTLPTRIAP